MLDVLLHKQDHISGYPLKIKLVMSQQYALKNFFEAGGINAPVTVQLPTKFSVDGSW